MSLCLSASNHVSIVVTVSCAWSSSAPDGLVHSSRREVVRGEACGPVRIRMEGFRPIFNEAIFPESEDGNPEPLLGYVILEQAQAAVDMLGHRLVPVRDIDLK